MKLSEELENVKNKYVQTLLNKLNTELNLNYTMDDVKCVGGGMHYNITRRYIFSFDEIRYNIDNDLSAKSLVDYYKYELDQHYKCKSYVIYQEWLDL